MVDVPDRPAPPLGGNVVRKDLGEETINEIARLLRESIEYALEHRQEALDYALNYARDLDPKLADRFVGMYVNQWTVDYGPGAERPSGPSWTRLPRPA